MTTVVSPRERYAPDDLPSGQVALRTLAAGIAGGVLALVAWFVLKAVSLPAFNTSMVTRALATAGSFVLIALAAVLAFLWVRGRKHWIISAVLALVPAGLVVTSLGIPLAATRLYLDGIQVDQGFRTQFLSRMTETASHADMSYKDLPTFYPMGWFWLGGRMANVLGMQGWEVYQPWALVSLAFAAAMLTPIWRKLTGSLPTAAAIAVVTTAIVLTEVPDEPYAAVVAMLLPAAIVTAYHALKGSWPATVALAAYLGVSACYYTLFTAIAALSVVAIAFALFFLQERSFTPLKHLLIVGLSSMLIAALAWGPYLLRVLSGNEATNSTANHFLPIEGTYFALPFLAVSLVGLLSLIGLIELIVRIREPEIASLGAALAVVYLWSLASMAVTLLGTSLLGFRLEVIAMLLFATLGVIGIANARLSGFDAALVERVEPVTQRAVTAVFIAVVALGALQLVQNIPVENEAHIDQAYADTDGFGERADRFPPDAAQYYDDIAELFSSHGIEPNDGIIFTDEINFMAFNPYFGFNAFTSHYANPLGEFDQRTDALKHWAELSNSDPGALTAAIDESPWRPPEAFILRGDLEAGTPLKTHVAHDIYPNQPNVRYEGIFFNPEAFKDADWDMEQIGPFVVVVRK